MAEPKTKKTGASVAAFLKASTEGDRKRDCLAVSDLMKKATKSEPAMWGASIVGFGAYSYKYSNGKTLEWPVLGFSPRKSDLTLYLPGLRRLEELTKKLGRAKVSGGCLHVKNMDDIDVKVLKQIMSESVRHVKVTHPATS